MKTTPVGFWTAMIALVSLSVCAGFPCSATGIRDAVDIDMSVSLTESRNGSISTCLNARVTCQFDAPGTTISFEMPPEADWLEDELAWSADLKAGEVITLHAPIRITSQGRFSIAACIRTPANLTAQSIRHLNFIAEEGRFDTSMDPFILMDLRQARTLEERRRIMIFQAQTTAVHPSDCDEPDGAAAWSATITGTAMYQDFDGYGHPIRFAKIEIIDEDPDAEYASLGLGSTNADGSYSIPVSCTTPGVIPDVRVCVYSRCAFGLFTGVCPTGADPDYTLVSTLLTDCPQGTSTVNLLTGRPVMNRQDDDSAARAFSVLDAILQASLEGYCLLIGDGRMIPPNYIETHFPAPSCYDQAAACIQIARNDALDWDIIYHEYFHYFTRDSAREAFNNGPGGEHDGSSAIPELGKAKGIRLAWDEGIATFMAVVTQSEDRAGRELGLDNPAMPGMGDSRFENIEGSPWFFDLEIAGQSYAASEGYGSELSVLGMLYDLWDQGQETVVDTNVHCADRIGLPLQTIWSLWNTGPWDDATKFYGYITALLMNADPNTVPYFSDLYAMNRMAPLATVPFHNARLSRSQIPTFGWVPNGDKTPGCENDHFILGIFKDGLRFSQCIYVEPDLRLNVWTPTREQWDEISSHATNSTRFYWYVMGWNEREPRTPPMGSGLGVFVSNVQSFVFRPNIYAQGMIGCPNKDPALYFNGFPLEVDPDSNEYPFHGSSSGRDYNGLPIYFILDGRFFLEQAMVRVDIDMYSDPAYTQHIRTDRAEAYSWNEWFYDSACDLIRDTSASCRPIWFAVKFSESANGGSGEGCPRPEIRFEQPACDAFQMGPPITRIMGE